MINIYSPEEIEIISQSGKITAKVLQRILAEAAVGKTTSELDKLAEKLILEAGGEPSFMKVPGYRFATCMNVNDMVVHGIPTEYRLAEGDRLGVDLGTYYKGFHSDASWSVIVSSKQSIVNSQRRKFLETGERALELAIKQCRPGNHIGDVSRVMQETVEGRGYSCVRQLVGHGVGRELHEDPEVPCYVRGRVENTELIRQGMVLAIEVIYNMGGQQVVYANDDGWTIVSGDGSISGLFEHTVAVTEGGVEILA